MAKENGPTSIDMTEEELNNFRKRIENKELLENDYALIEKMVEFVIWVQIKLQQSKISLNNLKRLLFGKTSEKSQKSKEKENSSLSSESEAIEDEKKEEGENSSDTLSLSSEKKSLKKRGMAGWRGARTRRMK